MSSIQPDATDPDARPICAAAGPDARPGALQLQDTQCAPRTGAQAVSIYTRALHSSGVVHTAGRHNPRQKPGFPPVPRFSVPGPGPAFQLGFSGKKTPENTNFKRPRPPFLSTSVFHPGTHCRQSSRPHGFCMAGPCVLARAYAGKNRQCRSSRAFA